MYSTHSIFIVSPALRRSASSALSVTMLLSAALLAAPGCSERRAAPVDADLARATLVEVLEHWKQQGSMRALRNRSPEIVVQDDDWSNGRMLQDFALVGEGRVEDANLFSDVELTLAPVGEGEPIKKSVTYIVGTDPVLTVFRAIL